MKKGNKKRNRPTLEQKLAISIAIINLIIALITLAIKLIELLGA